MDQFANPPIKVRQLLFQTTPTAVLAPEGYATISALPNKPDFIDNCIRYSMYGSATLTGAGFLAVFSTYLNSTDNTCPTEEASTRAKLGFVIFFAGATWGGLTKLADTLNDCRHARNFYIGHEQATKELADPN